MQHLFIILCATVLFSPILLAMGISVMRYFDKENERQK